jgi:two-component system OmpR family response regulator
MPALEKILHVDDDGDIQEVARLTLEAIGGFTVETCSSGQEALDRAPGFAPDLILLDVMMPRMDGPTTYSKLRAQPAMAKVPVIFMTAKVQSHETQQYLDLGAVGVITKPFDPMALSDQIRSIWAATQPAA